MIIRVEHKRRFTVVLDDTLRDSRLSFRATGLLAYLLSLPDKTSLSARALVEAKREGRDAILAALQELVDAGYLTRRRVQDKSTGRWYVDSTLVESPGNPPPSPGFQDSGNQAPENQAIRAFSTNYEVPLCATDLENDEPLEPEDLAARVARLRMGLADKPDEGIHDVG